MVPLALYWTVYFALHSLLAATWLKDAVARRWPGAARFYRLAYNQVSVWGFLLVIRYQSRLPESWLFRPGLALTGLAYGLLAAGLLLAGAALRGYDVAEFAGWAYVRRGLAAADQPLRTHGLNRLVRHPLHLGFTLALLGFGLLAPTTARTVFLACNLGYLAIGTWLEERKLSARFGEDYAQHRARVPLLPLRVRREEPARVSR